MKKTLIPNSVAILSTVYLVVMLWAAVSAENKLGVIFYAIALALFFVIFIYNRDSLACILKIEDSKLKVNYIFPNRDDIEVNLYMVQGNVILRRFNGGYFAGGLPSWPEYLNVKWYFSSERYELEFMYAGELKTLSFQVNPIGFKRFLRSLIENINVVSAHNIQYNQSNFGKGDLLVEVSTLIIKLLISE